MTFGPSSRHTVASLRAGRGKHVCAMLRVGTLDEAAAVEAAGVELLSVPPIMIPDPGCRDVAPRAFALPGDNFCDIGGPDDFLGGRCR
jgi:3-methyl-2-oxobutanoate hydroxymethyltransferase